MAKAGRPVTGKSNGAWRVKQKRVPGAAALLKAEQRHRLPLPREMRERQPFVIDVATHTLCAPWPRNRMLPGDDLRLMQVMKCLASAKLPGAVCWCWPDRAPEPIDVRPGWLASWCRDRCCYRLDPASQEAR
jgi:hypothetical protein